MTVIIETVTVDQVFEWLIDLIKNDATREQLIEMVREFHVDDLDDQGIVDLYEKLGGNLDGYKVVE